MIIDLMMGLILMISGFLTGGLGLGIIFIMEYFRKKTKESTGKENEMLFFILGIFVLHNDGIRRYCFFLLVNLR